MTPEAKAIPTKHKKRHVKITCPMCGKVNPARDYQLEHAFPNVMETFYGGFAKIRHDYVMEDDPAVKVLADVVQRKLVGTALSVLDEPHQQLLLEELTAMLESPANAEQAGEEDKGTRILFYDLDGEGAVRQRRKFDAAVYDGDKGEPLPEETVAAEEEEDGQSN